MIFLANNINFHKIVPFAKQLALSAKGGETDMQLNICIAQKTTCNEGTINIEPIQRVLCQS